jgi:hypothetical protein
MINYDQFIKYILNPVLDHLDANGRNDRALMMMTALVESAMGNYLHQLNTGVACGMYEMEPETHDDTIRVLKGERPELLEKVRYFEIPGAFDDDNAQEMNGNLYYATAMCRAYYMRFSEGIPEADDYVGLARYYKKFWNTSAGASQVNKAVDLYTSYLTELQGETII